MKISDRDPFTGETSEQRLARLLPVHAPPKDSAPGPDGLTDNERSFMNHMHMWGSDGYPVRKVGRKWHWSDAFGIKGSPTTYKTKREAMEAVERYMGILADKKAGRL